MFTVVFTPQAESNLTQLDRTIAQRVLRKIRWLAENFDDVTPEPLTGQWQGMYKLRVGDYRVLYTINQPEEQITVHLVRHRREVYK